MPPSEPPFSQTAQEEHANAWSHALGGLLALAGPVPWVRAGTPPDTVAAWAPLNGLGHGVGAWPGPRWGAAVFLLTMLLMFAVSTAYHALRPGAAKRVLRRCDHAVIFVFIAGTYTPFALQPGLTGDGVPLLALVWALALAGAALKLAGGLRHPGLSTALYLAFGWMVLAVGRPMLDSLPPLGLQALVAGGLAYTVGSGFFLAGRRLRYSHLVWHLFVITGCACHGLAVLQVVN